jgi:hypothetical protein
VGFGLAVLAVCLGRTRGRVYLLAMSATKTELAAALIGAALSTTFACKRAEPPAERGVSEEASAAKEPGEASEAEPPPAEPVDPIMTAPDFHFEWHSASGAVLLDQLSVDAKGEMTWLRPVSRSGEAVIHQLVTTLDAAELEALRAAVVEAGFMGLDPECGGDDGIADGNLLFVRVRANGKLHRVACGERLPAALNPIRSAVGSVETGERRSALESGPVAPAGALNPDLERPPPPPS